MGVTAGACRRLSVARPRLARFTSHPSNPVWRCSLSSRSTSSSTASSSSTSSSSLSLSSSSSPLARPPRLRFAPSPTGSLHLGGLRTALFNHLFARKYGGTWILRIEDTDQKRLVPGSVEGLQDLLSWAGLSYDEGPGVGGSQGPYVQSERLDLYRKYADQLIQTGRAYRDFRPKEESQRGSVKSREIADEESYVPPDEDEARTLMREGKPYTVRLKVESKDCVFEDAVFGKTTFPATKFARDPTLLKSDGWPTYHLASVVDDHEMAITHVLRGEEWLPSVPLHLDIYSAFGWSPPTFVHLPLIMNDDGKKLSKRLEHAHAETYRRAGLEPEAVINFIATMGYNHHSDHDQSGSEHGKSTSEVMTMEELIQDFDLGRIASTRAQLARTKLDYLNRHHLAIKVSQGPATLSKLVDRIRMDFHRLYASDCSQYLTEEYLRLVVAAISQRVMVLSQIPAEAAYFFRSPDLAAVAARQKSRSPLHSRDFPFIVEKLIGLIEGRSEAEVADPARMEECLEEAHLPLIPTNPSDEELKKARAAVKKTLRFALAGSRPGPEVPLIASILGKERVLERLRAAEAMIAVPASKDATH